VARAAPKIHLPDDDLTRGVEADEDAEPTPAAEGEAAVEGEAAAEGEATPRKRTRRGSRGGRGRKKKPAGAEASSNGDAPAATATVTEDEPEPAAADEPLQEEPSADGDSGDWGYTPMSEWGEDFESERRRA
jgi:ribonuclease E